MVHALRETRRVLRSGGSLIDLRPAAINRRVEVEIQGARVFVGEIDASHTFADHLAADDALRQCAAAGLFRQEHDAAFIFHSALDTAADLREYASGLRRSVVPESLLRRVDDLTGDDSDSSIHIMRHMVIARYRRL